MINTTARRLLLTHRWHRRFMNGYVAMHKQWRRCETYVIKEMLPPEKKSFSTMPWRLLYSPRTLGHGRLSHSLNSIVWMLQRLKPTATPLEKSGRRVPAISATEGYPRGPVVCRSSLSELHASNSFIALPNDLQEKCVPSLIAPLVFRIHGLNNSLLTSDGRHNYCIRNSLAMVRRIRQHGPNSKMINML